MNASASKVRLFELALENARSASPFVWRIRYALAHKGIAFETVYLGFTDIPTVFAGSFKTVPILEHGDTVLADSWDIAEYLDRAFPEPPLFNTSAELALVRFMDAWFFNDVLKRMFRLYVKDVHDAAQPKDRAYFRASREKNMRGKTLESVTADRASHLPAVRTAMAPSGRICRNFLSSAAARRILPIISRSAVFTGPPAWAHCPCWSMTTLCAIGCNEASICTAELPKIRE